MKPFAVVHGTERVISLGLPSVHVFVAALQGDTWRPRQPFGVLVSLSGSVDLSFQEQIRMWRWAVFPGDGPQTSLPFALWNQKACIGENKNSGPRNGLPQSSGCMQAPSGLLKTGRAHTRSNLGGLTGGQRETQPHQVKIGRGSAAARGPRWLRARARGQQPGC